MAETVGIDPISAIAGAAGDLFVAMGAIFGGKQERKAAEAQANAQISVANSQVDLAEINYLNTGINGLFDIQRAKLEIERQEAQNEGTQTNPINVLVISAGLLFFALIAYLVIIETKK